MRERSTLVREWSLGRLFVYAYPKSHGRSWHIWWESRFAVHVMFSDGFRVVFRRYGRA